MALGRIPFHILIGIIIGVFSLSRLSRDGTGIVGVVTGMVGIVTGMGNCHGRVLRLELLQGIVGVITGVVGDVKFVTGVFVVTEESMALGRIPFHIPMGIIIAVFSLSRLS